MSLKFRPHSYMKHAWKRIRRTVDTFLEIHREAQLWTISGSLAFATLLSIVPILALSFAVFKAVGGTEVLVEAIEPILLENLASSVNTQALTTFKELIDQVQVRTVGLGGFLGLLFTSMTMLAAAEKAIHQIWDAANRRPTLNRFSVYWLIVTLGPLLLSILLGCVTSQRTEINFWIPQGIGLFVLTFGAFFFVYRWVPNTTVHAREAAIAAFVATCLFHAARGFFPWYTREVLSLDHIYGSVAAIPLLMLWIQLLWLIVLWGVALNRTLQK